VFRFLGLQWSLALEGEEVGRGSGRTIDGGGSAGSGGQAAKRGAHLA
jgi:hypothetical protein